jgi:hypothetical protein
MTYAVKICISHQSKNLLLELLLFLLADLWLLDSWFSSWEGNGANSPSLAKGLGGRLKKPRTEEKFRCGAFFIIYYWFYF